MNRILPEKIIAVLATINDCETAQRWQTLQSRLEFSGIEMTEGITDATRLFSYLSIRKLDDFLTNSKKNDDFHWRDTTVDRKRVLQGKERLLPKKLREKINKSVVHLTTSGDLEVEDYEALDQLLKDLKPHLLELENQLRTSIGLQAKRQTTNTQVL